LNNPARKGFERAFSGDFRGLKEGQLGKEKKKTAHMDSINKLSLAS
jgi:hypothetical protein